jgi:hypothetical protein
MRVRLLAAFPGAQPGECAQRWIREAEPARRWALLAVGTLQDLGLDRTLLSQAFGARVQLANLPVACECCISPLVLGVTLGRLWRSGPWDELLILADARGHLPRLSQALSRALERTLPESQRESLHWDDPLGLMTPQQQVLLSEPHRAGHASALALTQWATAGVMVCDPQDDGGA